MSQAGRLAISLGAGLALVIVALALLTTALLYAPKLAYPRVECPPNSEPYVNYPGREPVGQDIKCFNPDDAKEWSATP